jgi:hypothetical protein
MPDAPRLEVTVQDPLGIVQLARNGTALACAQAARAWLDGFILRPQQADLDRLFLAVLTAGSSPETKAAEEAGS